MNKQAFLNLIKNPDTISSQDLTGLEEIIANFPFCQTAHILSAKGSSDLGQMLSEEKIRKAAAYTAERKNLKNLLVKEFKIEKPELKEPVISETENKTELIEKIKDSKEVKIERTEDRKFREDFKNPHVNEKLFSELEENLKRLHSLKEKAAKVNLTFIKEAEILKEEVKSTAQTIYNDSFIEEEKEEFPLIQNKLKQEPVKEHSEEINLYSSRLDEVLEENNLSRSFTSEAEILLNYLSFLEDHKNSALKDKKKTEEIIEKFIKKDPSMPYLNSASLPEEQEDKASQSYQLRGSLISENMANIYILQGKKGKAIEIYKQLMLKNPEKRVYFETQIDKIKEN